MGIVPKQPLHPGRLTAERIAGPIVAANVGAEVPSQVGAPTVRWREWNRGLSLLAGLVLLATVFGLPDRLEAG